MNRKTFTLLEIVIGIILLSVMILGAASFGSASEYFLQSSARKSIIINEMTYIIDHIAKYTAVATGDVTNLTNLPVSQGITATGATITIRYDTDGTPADYTNDTTVSYTWDGIDTLTFAIPSSGTPENLSSRVTAFSASMPEPNQVSIDTITVRYDPTVAVDARTNPELTLNHAVVVYALGHSVN